jgi:DNA-binding PadR family transcriptional regulator
MKRRGWVTAEWRISDNGRRARYYTLTATGRRQLADQEEAWSESSSAVDRLLRWA